ncbi:unnamed protein product, partial [Brassica rapa subsp. narinosa]
MAPNAANGFVMGSEHDHDENKQVSEEPLLEDENRDGEHKKILSEDIVIIHSETHSRSSSSSSSSSSYSSPPKHLPETDSPPVQVMDRDDNSNYDPGRIPSSVFETSKSNLQADWSCASNESLFSIHIGRNSFTVDAMKSGELYKSGELLAYSPELPMPPPPGKESDPLVESSAKVVDSDDDEKEQPPAVSWKTPTKSYRSNRSSNSTHSFSFPILAGAASDSASVETGEKKKQEKQSEETTKQPAEVENQKNSTIPKKLRSNFRREGDERERETPPEICAAFGDKEVVPVAVLFSGGLDSVILAALLDQCLYLKYEVDLLNVSFDGANAPERLHRLLLFYPLSPSVNANVLAGGNLSKLAFETKTKTRNSNCFSLCALFSNARFPFLDEDVIKTLLDIPLWEIADLEQPSGKGDKKILRQSEDVPRPAARLRRSSVSSSRASGSSHEQNSVPAYIPAPAPAAPP